VVNCGRRWGKTTLAEDEACNSAIQGRRVGWFAPTYKDLVDSWHRVERILAPVMARKNTQERRMDLITGGRLEFWTLQDKDAGRGRGYHLVVIDEAAHVPHLEYSWRYAIRPTLTDTRGRALFCSTPNGAGTFYHNLWLRGQGDNPAWASWTFPSWTNPYLAPGEIDEARADLPAAVFRQEYAAEFVEALGAVFRNVRNVATVTGEKALRGAHKGHRIYAGIDWGRQVDFTVVAIYCGDCGLMPGFLRMRGMDYMVQAERVRAYLEHWRPSLVMVEINAMGQPIFEVLARWGLPVRAFETNLRSKAQAIEALALAFEKQEIAIPDNPVLVGELLAYRGEPTKWGIMSYSGPEGGHDDTVIALALAYHASLQYRGGLILFEV